jgi:hypothetical protein
MKRTCKYKPHYFRDDIKTNPEYRKSNVTLKDGFEILSAHEMDADTELLGFCIIKGIECSILGGGKPLSQTLSTKVLLTRCPNIDEKARKTAVRKYLAKHWAFRLKEETFTQEQRSAVLSRKTSFRRLAREHAQNVMLGCLSYLRDRADGWLLLGVDDEKALAKLVRVSCGQKCVVEMLKTKRLPFLLVKQLLARKNQAAFDILQTSKRQRKLWREVVSFGRSLPPQEQIRLLLQHLSMQPGQTEWNGITK